MPDTRQHFPVDSIGLDRKGGLSFSKIDFVDYGFVVTKNEKNLLNRA